MSPLIRRVATTCIICAALAACSAPGRFVVKVKQDEIQRRIDRDKRFPARLKKLVFEVRVDRPRVALDGRTDRLELTALVSAIVAKAVVGRATATISGGVRYDATRGEFLLTDPHITRLETSHMPAHLLDSARAAIDKVVNRVLPAIPIYRLDRAKHPVARLVLKRAWIRGGKLYLEMGL